MERRPTAELAPVKTKTPPGNSFIKTVLPLSLVRGLLTNSLSDGQLSIAGSILIFEVRLAISTVGLTISIGPGVWWMTNPIQLLPHSVPPIWAPFIKMTRSQGCEGDRQRMISRRYGTREVCHGPGSLEDTEDKMRCASAHSSTV